MRSASTLAILQSPMVCRLVMASRCGDVDPAAVLYLLEHVAGGNVQRTDKLLNKQSGLIGLTGHQDLKRVLDDAAAGDQQAVTAAEVAAPHLVPWQLCLLAACICTSICNIVAGSPLHLARL